MEYEHIGSEHIGDFEVGNHPRDRGEPKHAAAEDGHFYAMNFTEWYIEKFREVLHEPLASSDAMSELEIDTALAGKSIPAAMLAYYSVAGRHWINTNHNHLRELSALETVGDYTIFMDENQVVAQWAIRNTDLTEDDPIVFQGQQRGSAYEWYPEKYKFSAFMIAMWRWVLTGEDPD